MTNNKKKKRNIKVGQVYLVDTFAAVRVKIRVTRKEVDGFTKKDIWYGVLISEADAKALQKAGVPYTKINVDESFIFEHQIVKLVRASNKERIADARIVRKRKKTR